MNEENIKNEKGEIIGIRTSYEFKNDCSDDNNHDMEYSQTLGLTGGRCRNCDYSTMEKIITL